MYEKAIQKVKGSIFPIFSSGPQSMQVLGTGFFIDEEGHFLTAAHVIQANPRGHKLGHLGNIPFVKFKNKQPAEIEIVYQDTSLDLALGKVDKDILPALEFAKESPNIGASIGLCGYPFPNIQKNVNGVTGLFDVSAVRQYWQPTILMDYVNPGMLFNKKFKSFLTQHSSLPGMSGGPVFNMDGAIVGVDLANYTRKVPRTKDIVTQVENGIGISLDEIRSFVVDAKRIA